MDYPIIGLLILAAIFFVIALIKKNKEDREDYQKQLHKSEMLEENQHSHDVKM